ncbi:MAG TPA: orotidine-5'-phosphate decarboxylase [Burkholderiales bacterium]|nr:orotidine-5'-phosphate decarboxylase [Burkholderiales bacterium]
MDCNPIIIALDYSDTNTATALVERLDPQLCRLKVGKQLFTVAGPRWIERLVKLDFAVFLDLKFHDIPTTVNLACRAAADLGVWMMNVHALGGSAMLAAARAGTGDAADRPLLTAVTLLTSMGESEMRELGLLGTPQEAVLRLAKLAQGNGLDGVVCSAQEAALLKRELGSSFRLVTPGIRPASAAAGDQQRIMTPAAARDAGADFLVIGRPITHAADPMQALLAIRQELSI